MQSTLSTTQGVQRLQRNADTQRLASRPLASRPANVLAAAPVEGLMSASRTSARLAQTRAGVIAQAGKFLPHLMMILELLMVETIHALEH